MKFYAIEYESPTKIRCTTGGPNGRTGRMSIACDIEAFGSKTTARAHCLGLSVAEFNDYLESVDV